MNTETLPVFPIKTDSFEGPLELLIELVEKRKFLINNISIAAVTDEYLARVSAMQEQSLPNTAQFISLAATLLLIKSKSLLPVLDLTDEESASIEELEERLRLYQIYRQVATILKEDFGKQQMYEPEFVPPRATVFLPDSYCNSEALASAMEGVIVGLPKEQPTKQIAKVRPVISLEEMMNNLRVRIEKQLHTSFFDINRQEPERKVVIVGFLAILELFKQGNVIITQVEKFEDIKMELDRGVTPKYY